VPGTVRATWYDPNVNSDSESVTTAPEHALPALQARSRRTQERLLAAAEKLLSRRTLEELTIADLAREARVSVGAFYARFPSKAALVPLLGERYDATLQRESERLFALELWSGLDLHARVRRLVRLAIRTYLRNRGLIRALSRDWRDRPQEVIDDGVRERRAVFHQRLADVLLGARGEIAAADPEAAVRFSLQLIGALLRDVLLVTPGHPHPTDLDERELTRELTHTIVAQLTTPARRA
jgi:AcrR family transcriptional regulator